jgi:hypothetical protein
MQALLCDGMLSDCVVDAKAEPDIRGALDTFVSARPASRAVASVDSFDKTAEGDIGSSEFQFLVRDFKDYTVQK